MKTCVKHQQPIFKTPHTQIEPGLITVTLTGAQVAQIVAGLGPGEVTAFQGQVARWQGLESPLAPGHV